MYQPALKKILTGDIWLPGLQLETRIMCNISGGIKSVTCSHGQSHKHRVNDRNFILGSWQECSLMS